MEYFLFAGLAAADQARFNAFIDAQPIAFTSQSEFELSDGQSFGFHIKQPAAGAFEALPDGSIELIREFDQPNLRVRMSPMWSGDSQRWRYLQLNRPYRFELDFYLYPRDDAFAGVDWANLFEIWGPFDAGDEGRNPAFEVMVRGKDNVFEFRQRGDSRKDHGRNYEFQKVTTRPFSPGDHKLVVDTVLSYEGKGLTKVWFDGEVVFVEENITNTYNSAPFADGKPMGGLINFPEIYCPESSVADEPIGLIVSRMRVSDEVGKPVLPSPEPEPEPQPSQPPAPTPEPKDQGMQGDFSANLNFAKQSDGSYAVTGKLTSAAVDTLWDPPTSEPPKPKYSDEIIEPKPSEPPTSSPPTSSVPMFDAVSNSLAYPRYQAEGNETRGWENPSVIYAKSTLRVYGTVETNGIRDLYEIRGGEKRLLKKEIIVQSVYKSGSALKMFAVQKADGRLQLISGVSLDHDTWTWRTEKFRDYLPQYSLGDILHAQDDKLWIKGDDFVKDQTDNYTDYRRYWFCDGEPLQVDLPKPKTGRRYDIYSMAVFKPSVKDWECRTKYVALFGLFHITNTDLTWNHEGTIDLVWATSDDGVKWDLPYGAQPAVDRGGMVGMVQPGAFLPYGKDLQVYCGAARFTHNTYRTAPDKTVGTGVITMPQSKFERAFG